MKDIDLDDTDSIVPDLTVPDDWPSDLPEDLLENLSKRDKHTILTLTVMAKKIDWIISRIVEYNDVLQKFEKRHRRIEKWARFLTSKWSPIIYVGGLIGISYASKLAAKYLP